MNELPPSAFVHQSPWSDVAEALLLISPRGVIRFATPSTAAFYGYDLEDIIGRTAVRFLAPESVEHVRASWRMMVDTPDLESYELYATMLTAAGHSIPVRASIWRLPDHEDFLVVHHVLDHLRTRLDTLYTIISRMSSSLELEELIDSMLREVRRLIPCKTSTIFMQEPDQTVQIRRWHEGSITTERSLPPDHLPEYPTSRQMRETGQPVLINDTQTSEIWVQMPGSRTIRSWLGAPLIHRGQYLGELTLDSPEPNLFSDDDAELARALAIQVAAAVHNARQFVAEQRRAKRFQAVSDVSKAINTLELDEVLDLVYEKVRALMDADAFFIGLYDADADTVRIAGFHDQNLRRPDTIISAGSGLTGIVLHEREDVIIQNASDDPLIKQAVQLGEQPHSLMIMPLIAQDEIVGVISVQSYEPYAYPPDDIALLKVIADAVATAVRNAQLYDQTATQLRALQTLHQLSLDLAGTQAPDTISELIVGAALALLKPDEVRLYVNYRAPWPLTTWIGFVEDGIHITQAEIPVPQNLLQQVHATNVPLVFSNLSHDPTRQQMFGTAWPVQAAALQPVQRGDRQIATLALLYRHPRSFSSEDQRVIEMLCLQAASAFENARYTINLTRRLNEVTALHELARRVGELETHDDILNTVVKTVRDALRCKSASVALLDPDGETVSLRAGSGLDDEFIFGHTFALGEYVAGAVVEQGRVIYVRDTYLDPEFRVIDPSIRSLMSVPLTVQRRTIGALNIDSTVADAFSAHHERVLTIAGGQIAAAIENLRLLDETRQHAAQLAEANESLAAQDELRRELIFQVSHDLRGPLQIVYGYADMMYNEMLGPITATQKDILGLVIKRSKSIERLTHDILAARPIANDMLELTPQDLTELSQQALTDAQMVHRDERFDFVGDMLSHPLPVEVDYNRLSRVFDNLIGNAVKFSPEGGTIRVSTSLDRAQGMALVSISDSGIGISNDKLPYIFERFYRGDRAFRKQFEGAGLGLYIVQQIIEAHQGKIWVDSQEGAGSTFTFALPLAERV